MPPSGFQHKQHPRWFWRAAAALLLFGISFGYVEAAVVVYLRALTVPLRQQLLSATLPGELFPLVPRDKVLAAGPEVRQHVMIELGREAATLIMLASVGLAVGRTAWQCLGAFFVAFGMWDIFFYVFLKVLVDWPASLLTWDILFLLPVPWVGPVLAPVLVALTMVWFGLLLLWREAHQTPWRAHAIHIGLVCLGGFLVWLSFVWDYRHILAGGTPTTFRWPLFGLGEALMGGACLHAFMPTPARKKQ